MRLLLVFDTEGAYEALGNAFGRPSSHVADALREFKDFAEQHDFETGAWRGEVVNGEPHPRPVVHAPVGWPLAN